jgi:dTDP-4-dehydrorhamnose 3,5-epimerase
VNVEKLAIRGVVRATPRTKAARRFDWYRGDALADTLPDQWHPTVGTMHTGERGHIAGLFCHRGPRILTCVSGRVALVVVDLRVGSPTFGRWIPEDLDTRDRVTIVVPGDVGWGFQTATWDAGLLSLHDESPGLPLIDPRDERLEILWPLRNGRGQGMPLAEALPNLPAFAAE